MGFRIIRTLGKSGVQDSPTSTGQEMSLSRRHSGLVLPEFQDQAHQGNVFISNEGTASTPISFAKTAYDADQPQFVIDVPAGKVIVPLDISIYLEDAAGTDNEIIIGAANALVGAGTSTSPTNTRNALINASGTEPTTDCTLRVLFTGNGTDVTTATAYTEFARFGDAFAQEADQQYRYHWNYLTDGPAPVIEGTGSLVIWIVGSTAPAGYITVKWLELNA